MHNTGYNNAFHIPILLWVLIDFRFPLKFLAPLVVMLPIIFKVGKKLTEGSRLNISDVIT